MKNRNRWLRIILCLCLFLCLGAGMAQAAQESFAQAYELRGTGETKTYFQNTRKKKKKKKQNQNNDSSPSSDKEESSQQTEVKEDGTYTSKEEVAAYLHQFGHLPSNYITKNNAKKLGWVNSEGNLDEVAPGKSIGGDYFGNYEGSLPEKNGRDYYECDIDYTGGYRGSKRIIYSNDGLIYYTEDHYQTFEQLY